MKIKSVVLLISSLLLSSCSLFPQNNDSNLKLDNLNTPTMIAKVSSTPTDSSPKSQSSTLAIKTKDGQIVVKLYSDIAPNTVANFINKTNSGFYNGLTWHRVISGFMAQGGDPTGTGTGGGSQKSELNNLPFKRGSLGLARTPVSKDISNDSQFFICFTTEGCQHLTGDYVNFGEVISGFDVLDKITQGDKILEITTSTK